MIKQIYRSKADIENLSILKTTTLPNQGNINYHGLIVNKPWGYEYLAFENDYLAIWILFIKKNHGTSLHCHPNKKTFMIPLSGLIQFSSLEGWMNLHTGDCTIIEKEVFHSSKSISNKGSMLMEIELPPNKKDLVRLRDEYGRKEKGYEGKKSMTIKTSGYQYAFFDTKERVGKVVKKVGKCNLAIHYHRGEWEVNRRIENEQGDLFCLLSGKLHDEAGAAILGPGDIIPLSELKNGRKLFTLTDANFLILSFNHGKSKSI